MSRWFGWLALVMLAGCDYVHTRSGAPFKIGQLKGQVWAIDPRDDIDSAAMTESRYATLVLSDSTTSCEVSRSSVYFVEKYLSDGQGIIFDFLTHSTPIESVQDWSGLWTGAKGYDYSMGTRELRVSIFSGGVLYTSTAAYEAENGLDWLEIESVDENGVSGEFSVGYWYGSFSAEDCGDQIPMDSPNLSNFNDSLP